MPIGRPLRRLSVPLIAGFVALATLGGCSTLDSLRAGMDTPSARIRDVTLRDLALDGATLAFDLEVSNPYSLPLPLVDLSYGLSSRDRQFLSGTAPLEGSIPAGGTRTVTLPASVAFSDVLAIGRDVRPGSVVPYTASLALTVDLPGGETLTLPLSRDGELPVPAVPEVAVESVTWEQLSLDGASAVVALRIGNTNAFPIDLSRVQYALDLGGTTVAESRVRASGAIDPGASQVVEIPFSIAPRDLGLAALNMLRGDDATYEIGGTLDVGTPFGALGLPFTGTGVTELLR